MSIPANTLRLSHRGGPPLASLVLIGVDHRCAPVELRERVAWSADAAEDLLRGLIAAPTVDEAMLISTCNRTELYVCAASGTQRDEADPGSAYRLGLQRAFLDRAPVIGDEGRFYVKHENEAARHLLEVACGLQSMILGEPEILGQVRRAADRAQQIGTIGARLTHVVRGAVEAGGRARARTGIGAGAVSFGYAVVELAGSIFRDLASCSVLMIGAGEMAQQVARNLYDRGANHIRVANRSAQRAEAFRAQMPHVEIVPFTARSEALTTADVVVASTGAREPVLTNDDLSSALRRRRRPLLVVDLGVPRNVDPAAGTLRDLFLHDVDTLDHLIQRNLTRRRAEMPKVQTLIDDELARVEARCRRDAGHAPVAAALQRNAERIRQQVIDAARHRFPDDTHDDLERLTRALVRKLLHHPTRQLRQHDDPAIGDLVQDLFDLDPPSERP
ncbi:MAG: glutamyl-tRNA reductase [Acidobacteriota bacterium]